jgi:broad specificity phosphatase PhoE
MTPWAGRRLLVWRHGQTPHNAAGIWQGQLDSPLSEVGRQQARAAAGRLAAYRPSLIISSDLARASDTARALADLVNLPIRYDERLREIHVGRWQGRTSADTKAEYPEQHAALARGEDIPRGVDGETMAQVEVRARAAVDQVVDELAPGASAVVATHGVAGRAAVASLVGLDQASAWTSLVGLGNCCWAEVREYPAGWRIWGWNLGVGPIWPSGAGAS